MSLDGVIKGAGFIAGLTVIAGLGFFIGRYSGSEDYKQAGRQQAMETLKLHAYDVESDMRRNTKRTFQEEDKALSEVGCLMRSGDYLSNQWSLEPYHPW